MDRHQSVIVTKHTCTLTLISTIFDPQHATCMLSGIQALTASIKEVLGNE
jgi:hypothetical protein